MAYRKTRTDGRPAQRRQSFGALRRLPSGRWQAGYLHPTARTSQGRARRVMAPRTFGLKSQARSWLAAQQAALDAGTWVDPLAPPPPAQPTFAAYAQTWLAPVSYVQLAVKLTSVV